MKCNLTKHVKVWKGEGQNLYPISKTFQYEVRGLPPGEEAQIGLDGERWRILRFKGGAKQGDWAGDYKSENEALAALQKEYND